MVDIEKFVKIILGLDSIGVKRVEDCVKEFKDKIIKEYPKLIRQTKTSCLMFKRRERILSDLISSNATRFVLRGITADQLRQFLSTTLPGLIRIYLARDIRYRGGHVVFDREERKDIDKALDEIYNKFLSLSTEIDRACRILNTTRLILERRKCRLQSLLFQAELKGDLAKLSEIEIFDYQKIVSTLKEILAILWRITVHLTGEIHVQERAAGEQGEVHVWQIDPSEISRITGILFYFINDTWVNGWIDIFTAYMPRTEAEKFIKENIKKNLEKAAKGLRASVITMRKIFENVNYYWNVYHYSSIDVKRFVILFYLCNLLRDIEKRVFIPFLRSIKLIYDTLYDLTIKLISLTEKKPESYFRTRDRAAVAKEAAKEKIRSAPKKFRDIVAQGAKNIKEQLWVKGVVDRYHKAYDFIRLAFTGQLTAQEVIVGVVNFLVTILRWFITYFLFPWLFFNYSTSFRLALSMIASDIVSITILVLLLLFAFIFSWVRVKVYESSAKFIANLLFASIIGLVLITIGIFIPIGWLRYINILIQVLAFLYFLILIFLAPVPPMGALLVCIFIISILGGVWYGIEKGYIPLYTHRVLLPLQLAIFFLLDRWLESRVRIGRRRFVRFTRIMDKFTNFAKENAGFSFYLLLLIYVLFLVPKSHAIFIVIYVFLMGKGVLDILYRLTKGKEPEINIAGRYITSLLYSIPIAILYLQKATNILSFEGLLVRYILLIGIFIFLSTSTIFSSFGVSTLISIPMYIGLSFAGINVTAGFSTMFSISIPKPKTPGTLYYSLYRAIQGFKKPFEKLFEPLQMIFNPEAYLEKTFYGEVEAEEQVPVEIKREYRFLVDIDWETTELYKSGTVRAYIYVTNDHPYLSTAYRIYACKPICLDEFGNLVGVDESKYTDFVYSLIYYDYDTGIPELQSNCKLVEPYKEAAPTSTFNYTLIYPLYPTSGGKILPYVECSFPVVIMYAEMSSSSLPIVIANKDYWNVFVESGPLSYLSDKIKNIVAYAQPSTLKIGISMGNQPKFTDEEDQRIVIKLTADPISPFGLITFTNLTLKLPKGIFASESYCYGDANPFTCAERDNSVICILNATKMRANNIEIPGIEILNEKENIFMMTSKESGLIFCDIKFDKTVMNNIQTFKVYNIYANATVITQAWFFSDKVKVWMR